MYFEVQKTKRKKHLCVLVKIHVHVYVSDLNFSFKINNRFDVAIVHMINDGNIFCKRCMSMYE